jgi:hypothetical protein
LHRRVGRDAWRAQTLSEGEALALGWAVEMTALAPAASDRTLWFDFDRFLADPAVLLSTAFHHLDIGASGDDVRRILGGPHMSRYSKAPEHAYDAALRREVQQEARALHGGEIRRGLKWLERAAADFEPVRAAVAFAGIGGAGK